VARVYISIGSNIEREKNIRSAVQSLQNRFGPLTLSSVYESPAAGFAGDPFFNLAAAFDTDIPPDRLITALHDIESAHGRVRGERRFAPRVLDLDLVLYGDIVRHDQLVDLPRPEVLRYSFVLVPVAEIAPNVKHPESGIEFHRLANAGTTLSPPIRRIPFNPRRKEDTRPSSH